MRARYHVRRLRPDELDSILKLEHASFGKDAYDRNLFATLRRRHGELFLVAEHRRKIRAYCVTAVDGSRAELVSVAVDPAYRRKGAASALLESTLRRVRRRGVTRFCLMVKVTNRAARAFYEKYGFAKVRTVPGYYEDGRDGVRMCRTWPETNS